MIHIARHAAAFCSAIVLISQTGCGWYGTSNSAVATPSTATGLAVTVGGSQTYSVTFNSSDDHVLRSLVVTTDLQSLGQGWKGPASFTCAVVTTGSGCVLNLTYAPTSPDSGTLIIEYTYRDDQGTSRTASQHVDYSATASNNVEAAVSPSGQINAVAGASAQSVGVNFTTDDGNPATELKLDLSSLPDGWSSTATTFSCAVVSIGNGCQLTLSYAPAGRGSGTLSLNYTYNDNSGAAKSGTLNIPYSATTQNDVVASATPNGQVNAIVGGGSQSVSVQFTTNDGNPATGLGLTLDLTALPAGWSSPDTSFNCQMVSTGNGCQLPLVYAPGTAGSGMLTVAYTYSNNSGVPRNGSLNIPYAATTHDNAVATVFPLGQIDAIAGSGSQTVTITFTTDDGNVGTSLHLTSSLSALPAGWSSTLTGLSCATFSIGNTCSLPLLFAPGAASSGTLPLNYTYDDNSGAPKSGSVSIMYRATASDNVIGTPDHSTLSVVVGSSATDNVTFTTDDGNTAGTLTITTALGSLPVGWSTTAGTFSCASVSTGTACKLPLTYAPSTAGNGTLTLNYSYTDNSGTPKTGSVNVAYVAIPLPNVYVTDYYGNAVSYCPTNADGTLGSCVSTGSGFDRPTSITFFGNRAYVTNDANYTVSVCTVVTGGALNNCAPAGSLNEPQRVTINPAGTLAYIWDNFGVNLCAINASDGTFSSCTQTGVVAGSGNLIRFPVISSDGARMYGTWYGGGGYDMMHFHPINLISLCPIESDGTVPTCGATGTNADNANLTFALTASDLYASSESDGIVACPVNADGSLGSCQSTASGTGFISGLAVGSNYAYLVAFDATIKVCPVNVNGLLGACTVLTPGVFSTLSAVALH